MPTIQQAYRILGIPTDASVERIEAAFRQKQQQFQADAGNDPWEFDDVKEAYETLRRRSALPTTATLSPAPHASTGPTLAPPSEDKATGEPKIPKHLLWQAFFRDLPLQSETKIFILVSIFDIVMTYALLKIGGIETNPIANYVLQRWGFDGMILLKMLSIAFVTVVVQIIALRDLIKARRVLIAGSLIVLGVVLYSGTLLMRVLR